MSGLFIASLMEYALKEGATDITAIMAAYSDIEIAKKIGVTANWINMIVALLERGDGALLRPPEDVCGTHPPSSLPLPARAGCQ